MFFRSVLVVIVLAMSNVCAANNGATQVIHVSGQPAKVKTQIMGERAVATVNPILFATAVPTPDVYTSMSSTFGNQRGLLDRAPRGGDLAIRYADGSVRFLTAEAGYGHAGAQDATSIAVRDPLIYWDGTKAIFSMVIGGNSSKWQLYEVTGLAQGQTAVITKVAGQNPNFNNIYPAYGSDGAIFFASDSTRDQTMLGYPPLDEYEAAETTSGLWKLNAARTSVTQCTDSPSGAFNPSVAPDGRVIFTGWDHLKRDGLEPDAYGTFDYTSETGARTSTLTEVFPESLSQDIGNVIHHDMNIFQPWTVNQDCTTMETINHIGQQELQGYAGHSFNDDPNLIDLGPTPPNANRINNWLAVSADPNVPGRFIGVDAPEFYTDMAGGILAMNAPIGKPADQITVDYLTPRSGRTFYSTPPADFDGRYRKPAMLTNGQIVAAYAPNADRDGPGPLYKFRLYFVAADANGVFRKTTPLVANPIIKNVSGYNGALWEMDPVEVVARPVPPLTSTALQAPELAAFSQAGVDPATFTAWLVQKGLALGVTRNATARDDADKQQPFNLHVPGGVQTIGHSGKVYDIKFLQPYQGDALRGYGGINNTDNQGRRRLARPLHDPNAVDANPTLTGAPTGAVQLGLDGSIAMFLPARRAMTWHTTDPTGTSVVKERYWLTMQPGEVRACPVCHGVNSLDQAGRAEATNTPQALVDVLVAWKAENGGGPPPPVCPAMPNPITRTAQCPAGSTGSYTQTATYAAAQPQVPPDQCWVFGPYLPTSPPADACTVVTPPPPLFRVSIKQGNQSAHIFAADATIPGNWPACGRVASHWRCTQGTDVIDFPTAAVLQWTFVTATSPTGN